MIRVIDFETTGADPADGAEVCEVGYCDLVLEQRGIDNYASFLCGVKSMPPEVRAVHHISLAECEGKPPFNIGMAMAPGLSAIAAHNAEFETKFFTPTVPVICTYKAALRVWPDAPSHSNGALRYWLEDQGKIRPDHPQTQPAHRAGPDAYVTAHILLALFDAGATGRDMIAWTKEPRVLPKCPIGAEWRGKLWAEVDRGFLRWMTGNATMEPDLKWNAQRELDRRAKGDN